ncbi:MAG: ATP-binding protein [Endomicrobium sp.]|jgi:Holliday junction resolvase-like predicted endonuclease|nr:ATP-binding protein [Endomicrobium sp.]
MKRLPIGTQSFEVLRRRGDIYVDKTEHIYNLISNGRIYFLSRPRRFGKSLLISTLKNLFKGNKEIFEGLYIWDKWDWAKKYPVIHLDFAEIQYATAEQLEISLDKFLNDVGREEKIELQETATRLVDVKFAELIEKMHKNRGEQVVILIDEYDKPMIDSLNKAKEVHQEIKETLHNFYQVIKASDEHIKFMFMTGVSRFAGLSIFSALNNLNDITMNNKYASICGYTQEELEDGFKEYIGSTAEYMAISKEELLREIKYWYNGYSWDGKERVYNPFSTLKFFDNKEFEGYWFETGTPTFLIEQIKKKDDLESLSEARVVSSGILRGNSSDYANINNTALLFQTGYLTIKKKERSDDGILYTIDFPNKEVKDSFLMILVSEYVGKSQIEVFNLNVRIQKALISKKEEELQEALRELYANAVYDTDTKKEGQRQTLFVIAARLSGFEVETEVHTNKGRIDVVLKKGDRVVVVEIKYSKDNKLEGMLKEAMLQIRKNKYYEKYASNDVILLALAFGKNKEIRCRFENI